MSVKAFSFWLLSMNWHFDSWKSADKSYFWFTQESWQTLASFLHFSIPFSEDVEEMLVKLSALMKHLSREMTVH